MCIFSVYNTIENDFDTCFIYACLCWEALTGTLKNNVYKQPYSFVPTLCYNNTDLNWIKDKIRNYKISHKWMLLISEFVI